MCNNRKNSTFTYRTFTLIELLVVIAIIGILASLLLPALQHSKYSVRKIACASNLKQIGMSTLLYANDFDGEFPPYKNNSSSWPWGFSDWGLEKSSFYRDYLKTKDIYFCPQDLSNGETEGARCYPYFPSAEPSSWRVNISYNYFFGRDAWVPQNANHRGGEIFLKEVKDASRATILADVMRFGQSPNYTIISNWNHKGMGITGVTTIHKAGGNMFYVDGHVSWMQGTEKLLSHRQKMKSNDDKSYAAEQPGDTP